MNIVAFAVKDGVISSANDGVQVAGRSAMRAGIALARDTNALPIARTCFDTHLERFSLLHGTFTVAGAAGCMFFPVPWQRAQAVLNFMRPPVWGTWPVPPQSEQVPGDSM